MREKQIEENLINKLVELKYTYRPDITDRDSLERNFRTKLETLNRVHLSDSEFNRLMEEITDSDVFASSRRLREKNTFFREDGTPLQYTLVNIKNWCKNDYEVIHQLRVNTRNSWQRYDVIILINGLPIVQVELKTLDINPRRAIQQIVDYKNDIGNGYTNSLLCFMQMFIVSNGTYTCYFANNNNQHFNFNADEQFLPVYKWADEKNEPITELYDFCDAVLQKCQLGKLISQYMVLLASEQKILIMRPYQIYAVEAIKKCVEENRGNGYIWHTTGSGKTLTSFKASTLLKDNPDISKCLFVVDRKDLDKQTREEFNKFQDGCVEENTNTEKLVRRLLSEDYADKIIVTTIQKLGIALNPQNSYAEDLQYMRDERLVFIFDECHRSQFGDNHKAIKKFFPKAQLFGFTGTPIFDKNASYTQVTGEEAKYKTTKDIFEKELHSYTITEAIDDKNVLKFHIDYFKPDCDNDSYESARKLAVVKTILEKHNAVTADCRFNAIFATASINDAISYYHLFHKVQSQETSSEFEPLNVACVFSPPAEGNRDIMQLQEELLQEQNDNKTEPERKKKALEGIIENYNRQYGTECSISEFDAYYQNVQKRIKDQKYSNADYAHKNKIDIVIVVDMLLTGFDSKYLNTLYVDKNLKYHNLIQAFSRTNRVLNDTKPFGNILDFRGQQDAVNEAITMFSGKSDENEARQIWLVEPVQRVNEKYRQAVSELKSFMSVHNLDFKASEVAKLRGDDAKAGFIRSFQNVQKLWTQLNQYTDVEKEEPSYTLEEPQAGYSGISKDELQAFRGAYLKLAYDIKKRRDRKKESIAPEIDDLDLEFVLFASAIVDYDYIMSLIANYTGSAKKVRITKEQLVSLICSSANLLDEKDDIIAYIDSLDTVNGMTEQEVKDGYEAFKELKFDAQLTEIANRHGLDELAVKEFANNIVGRRIFDGEKLNDLLAPLGLPWKARIMEERSLMSELVPLLKHMTEGQKISGLSAYDED